MRSLRDRLRRLIQLRSAVRFALMATSAREQGGISGTGGSMVWMRMRAVEHETCVLAQGCQVINHHMRQGGPLVHRTLHPRWWGKGRPPYNAWRTEGP
eukprot:359517-Chlamydomonas_euryale.AAC.20